MLMGILAAGEGSRLQAVAPFKPLIKVGGVPLIERTLKMVGEASPERIMIIFNELEKSIDFSTLPMTQKSNTDYFFQTTPSSLHSLYEVMKRSNVSEDDHIIFSMVDSILKQDDFNNFYKYCSQLARGEHAVLTTTFIEDEKPLTLQLGEGDKIEAFQTPLEESTLITSGMYCFSGQALYLMKKCVDDGVMKMRNFLTLLVTEGETVRSFEIEKSLDIDRPEDIKSAEKFLGLL